MNIGLLWASSHHRTSVTRPELPLLHLPRRGGEKREGARQYLCRLADNECPFQT